MLPKIVVCASGEGTNFEAIVRASLEQKLGAQVVGLLTNRSGIGAIDRAHRLGIPHQVIAKRQFSTPQLWDQAMVDLFRSWQADWIVLAGYLAQIGPQVLEAYQRRIINSHPSLLPKYGGPGMYGHHVHSAVIQANEKESGVTIHFVDADYDSGPIIAQEKVQVLPGDTPNTLADRVKMREAQLYPRVIHDLVTGRI